MSIAMTSVIMILATPTPAMAAGPSRPTQTMSANWLTMKSVSMRTIGHDRSRRLLTIEPRVQSLTKDTLRRLSVSESAIGYAYFFLGQLLLKRS